MELNLRQLDDDLNEDHYQHCNRGEERQPGEDREWRERAGGGQMWMKLSGSETGNTIASDTSLGLSCRHSF